MSEFWLGVFVGLSFGVLLTIYGIAWRMWSMLWSGDPPRETSLRDDSARTGNSPSNGGRHSFLN